MNRDDSSRSDPGRLLSARLGAADLVEATCNGSDLGLAGFVGRRALRVVVGGRDATVLRWPHPLPPERLDALRPGPGPWPDPDVGPVDRGPSERA